MNTLYQVRFFKKLIDSTGHPVEACQAIFEIHAPDRECAVDDARLAFAKRRKIGHWSLHADYATVDLLHASERPLAAVTTNNLAHAVSR